MIRYRCKCRCRWKRYRCIWRCRRCRWSGGGSGGVGGDGGGGVRTICTSSRMPCGAEPHTTLLQMKSTNVGSGSPMYSMIFLLIHGLIFFSISTASICSHKRVISASRDWKREARGRSTPHLRGVQLVLEQLLFLRGDLVDEALDVFSFLLGALRLLFSTACAGRCGRARGGRTRAFLVLLFFFFT